MFISFPVKLKNALMFGCILAAAMVALGWAVGAKFPLIQDVAAQSDQRKFVAPPTAINPPALPETQERDPWKAQLEKTVVAQKQRIDLLQAELKKAQDEAEFNWKRAKDAEAKCLPVAVSPGVGVSTVLYESSRASVNVSLISLPGAPRVALGKSTLAPRWVIPGRIQPQMLGETRQAIYYYFDPAVSTWQGPFAPQRVTQ